MTYLNQTADEDEPMGNHHCLYSVLVVRYCEAGVDGVDRK